MFGNYFYNERVRRCVGAFGSLFNDIYVLRKEKSGSVNSQQKVPLTFAPKRKFISMIERDAANALNKKDVIAITLPRMSFETVGLQYDPQRQLARTQSRVFTSPTNSANKQKIYTKTPYNIQFQLNVYAKNHDDALQIVEQIIPYFTPSYTLTMRPLDDYPQIKDDIPIVLNGISFIDDYEGAAEQRRTIIYTLDFEMKLDFYGPAVDGKIIRQADVSFFMSDDSDTTGWSLESIVSITVDPEGASPDSDYTLIETITKPGDGDSV